jgi:uncharacterized membrane protein YccF (DUF307 family)
MKTLLNITWLGFGSKLIPVSLMPLGKEIVPSHTVRQHLQLKCSD